MLAAHTLCIDDVENVSLQAELNAKRCVSLHDTRNACFGWTRRLGANLQSFPDIAMCCPQQPLVSGWPAQ